SKAHTSQPKSPARAITVIPASPCAAAPTPPARTCRMTTPTAWGVAVGSALTSSYVAAASFMAPLSLFAQLGICSPSLSPDIEALAERYLSARTHLVDGMPGPRIYNLASVWAHRGTIELPTLARGQAEIARIRIARSA